VLCVILLYRVGIVLRNARGKPLLQQQAAATAAASPTPAAAAAAAAVAAQPALPQSFQASFEAAKRGSISSATGSSSLSAASTTATAAVAAIAAAQRAKQASPVLLQVIHSSKYNDVPCICTSVRIVSHGSCWQSDL
jgi:hypothetical protein